MSKLMVFGSVIAQQTLAVKARRQVWHMPQQSRRLATIRPLRMRETAHRHAQTALIIVANVFNVRSTI